ncbi:hypothetical protein MRB76_000001 [Shigella flexneri]|nr:hypothetical protein [Salmonella enterica subsp. enterica serovar Enteritidis]EFI3750592.1 hypothetical protein [Escherichia coli]EIZ9552557.1 hypothetical protein [Shigella flexneri]
MNPLKRAVNVVLNFIPNYQRAARYRHWYNFVYQPVVEGHIANLEKVGGDKKYLMVTIPDIIRKIYEDQEEFPNVADILLFIQAYRFRLTPPKSVIRPWFGTKTDGVEQAMRQRFNGQFARHTPRALRVMMEILDRADICVIPMIIESELFYLFEKRFEVTVVEYSDGLMVFNYVDCDDVGGVRYVVLDVEDRSSTMTAAQLRRFVAYLEWRDEDDEVRRKNHVRQKYARLSTS